VALWRYRAPWYYGVSGGVAFAQVFRPRDRVRFAQSPSGCGAGNPPWDFQWYVPDYRVGQRYQMVMRAVLVPGTSRAAVEKAVAPHVEALNGG
jgi:hypothetical protein